MEEFFTNTIVDSIYFLYHDAARIIFDKNAVEIRTIP